jgi:hypothetical protein
LETALLMALWITDGTVGMEMLQAMACCDPINEAPAHPDHLVVLGRIVRAISICYSTYSIALREGVFFLDFDYRFHISN